MSFAYRRFVKAADNGAQEPSIYHKVVPDSVWGKREHPIFSTAGQRRRWHPVHHIWACKDALSMHDSIAMLRKALVIMDHAVKKAPGNYLARIWLADIQYRLGNYADADQTLKRAKQLNAKSYANDGTVSKIAPRITHELRRQAAGNQPALA